MRQNRSSRRGFTLLEMLTVIVIIGLLLAIGVPSVLQFQKNALKRTSIVTVRLLEGACRLYSSEFKNRFPPSQDSVNWSGYEGRHVLVQMLAGYSNNDGLPGFGYKTVNGRVFKPWVDTSKLVIGMVANDKGVFKDSFENEIYYYCQNDDWFNARLASSPPATAPFTTGHNAGGPADINAYVTDRGTPVRYMTTEVVLCTKGADGIWGSKDWKNPTATPIQYYKDMPDIDDVTNFFSE